MSADDSKKSDFIISAIQDYMEEKFDDGVPHSSRFWNHMRELKDSYGSELPPPEEVTELLTELIMGIAMHNLFLVIIEETENMDTEGSSNIPVECHIARRLDKPFLIFKKQGVALTEDFVNNFLPDDKDRFIVYEFDSYDELGVVLTASVKYQENQPPDDKNLMNQYDDKSVGLLNVVSGFIDTVINADNLGIKRYINF